MSRERIIRALSEIEEQEPVEITREEFLIGCESARNAFSDQMLEAQMGLIGVNSILDKAERYHEDGGLRVKYYFAPGMGLTLGIEPKGKAGFDLEEKERG